jgi:hypothetical protein
MSYSTDSKKARKGNNFGSESIVTAGIAGSRNIIHLACQYV